MNISDKNVLRIIETTAKICYQSKPKQDPTNFIKMLLHRGHYTPFEQVTARVEFITDRAVTHELVRHRLASFNQESTRYVSYGKKDIKFILPVEFYDIYDKFKHNISEYQKFTDHKDFHSFRIWVNAMSESEKYYKRMLEYKCAPQLARSVLPNSLKTQIIVNANLREWMHILTMRCAKDAHPQIRLLMIELLKQFHDKIPIIFDELYEKYLTGGAGSL